jgi:hypothetical protein
MRISHTTILLFALAVQIACADDKTSAPDFSQYQHADNFRQIVSVQTNVVWQLNQQTNILAITDFDYGNDRVVDQYFVSENGKGYSWRWVPNWAHQPGKKIKQLFSEADLTNLESAVKEFPSQNSTPPVERLVIVSFKSGTNWITRTYDRQSLPKAMLNVCVIAELGIETKNQK